MDTKNSKETENVSEDRTADEKFEDAVINDVIEKSPRRRSAWSKENDDYVDADGKSYVSISRNGVDEENDFSEYRDIFRWTKVCNGVSI